MKRLTKARSRTFTLIALGSLSLFVLCLSYRILSVYGPHHVFSEPDIIHSPPAALFRNVTEVNAPLFVPSTRVGESSYHVPILMYHYISVSPDPRDTTRIGLSTPPRVFEEQLKTLSGAGYETITFTDLFDVMAGKRALPEKCVILTFDDGYVDFHTFAYPLLVKYAMKGTAFIPTGLVGHRNYLTWGQIEEMSESPFVTFGAHTVHHYSLPSLREAVLEGEVKESKRVLEAHVKQEVYWFAYPYGQFDRQVVKAVRNAGYFGAVMTLPGSVEYESRLFYIPRVRPGLRTGADLIALLK